MVAFIDQYRRVYGVEPICAVLPIAPSTYYRCKELERSPDKRSHRVRRYESLEPEVRRVYEENRSVYGARKVWKQLNRESIPVGRWNDEIELFSVALPQQAPDETQFFVIPLPNGGAAVIPL